MANNIGIINKPYVSAVPLLDQRSILPEIVDLQDDAEWTQMMLETGRRVETVISHYDTFENDAKFIIIDTTGATVTGSGTSVVTVTNLSSGNNNYIIVSDTLLLPNGKVALVQTVSTTTLANDTIVMRSVDATNLTLVTGDKLSDIGTAMEEGSLSPAPRRYNLFSIRNLIQVFTETFTITDIQGASLREVKVNGDYHVLPQAFIDTLQVMRGKMAASWWAGQVSSTLFEDQSPVLTGPQGNGVQTTRGLDSYVTTYGISPSVTTPGQITTPDVQDLCDRLTAVKAPAAYMMVAGNGPKNIWDIWMKNLGSSGAQSVRLLDNNKKETNFNADKLIWGGFEFDIVRNKLLSNPQVFNYVASGSTKQSISRAIYLLPSGQCPVYGGTDGNGGTIPYFTERYQGYGPQMSGGRQISDGKITEILTGGLAPVPTDSSMTFSARFTSRMGADIRKPQVFGKWIVQ